MCRIQVYVKRCTTCSRPFKDRHNREEVYLLKQPCPYVLSNRLDFGGCGQRTRQERRGRMDWRECQRCIDEAWLAYAEDGARDAEDEDDGGGGDYYGMGGTGGNDVPRGFGNGSGKDDRGGQGGSGQGGEDGKGKQPITNRT